MLVTSKPRARAALQTAEPETGVDYFGSCADLEYAYRQSHCPLQQAAFAEVAPLNSPVQRCRRYRLSSGRLSWLSQSECKMSQLKGQTPGNGSK